MLLSHRTTADDGTMQGKKENEAEEENGRSEIDTNGVVCEKSRKGWEGKVRRHGKEREADKRNMTTLFTCHINLILIETNSNLFVVCHVCLLLCVCFLYSFTSSLVLSHLIVLRSCAPCALCAVSLWQCVRHATCTSIFLPFTRLLCSTCVLSCSSLALRNYTLLCGLCARSFKQCLTTARSIVNDECGHKRKPTMYLCCVDINLPFEWCAAPPKSYLIWIKRIRNRTFAREILLENWEKLLFSFLIAQLPLAWHRKIVTGSWFSEYARWNCTNKGSLKLSEGQFTVDRNYCRRFFRLRFS